MSCIVIDTNVILAANGSHADLSIECVQRCVERLLETQKKGTIVLDDQFRIIKEYLKRTNMKAGKGVGDVFLKWLLQNTANEKYCVQVSLTELSKNEFQEFPIPTRQSEFDPADRKFVAVSNCHPKKPNLLQASDCKWLDWHSDLKACGITVDFLCPDDICRFYRQKFPEKNVPKAT